MLIDILNPARAVEKVMEATVGEAVVTYLRRGRRAVNPALRYQGRKYGYNIDTMGRGILVKGVWDISPGSPDLRVKASISDGRTTLRYHGTCYVAATDRLFFDLQGYANDERARLEFKVPFWDEGDRPILVGRLTALDTDSEFYTGPYVIAFERLTARRARSLLGL